MLESSGFHPEVQNHFVSVYFSELATSGQQIVDATDFLFIECLRGNTIISGRPNIVERSTAEPEKFALVKSSL